METSGREKTDTQGRGGEEVSTSSKGKEEKDLKDVADLSVRNDRRKGGRFVPWSQNQR